MPLDNIIPLLFQLKALGILGRVRIISFNVLRPGVVGLEALIEQNHSMKVALQEIGVEWVSLPGIMPHMGFQQRVLVRLRVLWGLRFYLAGRVLTLCGPLNGLSRSLVRVNRILFGGRYLESVLLPYSLEALRRSVNAIKINFGRTSYSVRVNECDGVLSSFSREEFEEFTEVDAPLNAPFIKLGYARGFPAWQKFVHRNADLTSIRRPFLFWPMTVLWREEPSGDFVDLVPVMKETLRILKQFEGRLHVVFRMHPTTDIDMFQGMIDEVDFKDYSINNAHPHELISESLLTFSNTGSSLFCDAYFMGCPVVQYVTLDPGYYVRGEDGIPMESLFTPDVDIFIVNDPQALIDTIENLLDKGRDAIRRDAGALKQRFPVPSDQELIGKMAPYL